MTFGFAAAETAIETRASRVKIANQFGEQISPREVVWLVGHTFDAESDRLYDAIEKGEITCDEYQSEWEKLIESFEKFMFFRRLEKNLESLK